MLEGPSKDALEKKSGTEAVSSIPEKDPNFQGGATEDKAVQIGQEFDARQAAGVREDLLGKMGTVSEVKEEKKVIDFSLITSRIESLKSGGNTKGWFKKAMESLSGDNIKNQIDSLNAGLYKVKNYEQFARMYAKALEEGGEDHALEYVDAIGKGKLVKSEGGELVSTGINSRRGDGILNQ